MKTEEYTVDDRGNVVEFYEVVSGDIIATLDRESGENGDETTWDGAKNITDWAIKNGYADEIKDAVRI